MTRSSFNFFRNSSSTTKNNKKASKRSLRMEPLEERQLLAVSFAEFQQITANYPQLTFPGINETNWQTSLNVIEIGGEDGMAFSAASLRQAITDAAASNTPDLIVVRTGATPALNTLNLGGQELTLGGTGMNILGGSITIVGLGDAPLKLVAGNSGNTNRVMSVREGADIRLANMTLTGGNVAGDGGGLYLHSDDRVKVGSSNVTLVSVTIEGNTASNEGGGFYQYRFGNTVTSSFTNVLIAGNTAGFNGGGLYISNGGTTNNTATLTNCTVVGNRSNGDAVSSGGIYSNQANNITIINSVFWGNTVRGGGVNDNLDIALSGGGTKTVDFSLWGSSNIDGTSIALANNLPRGTNPGFAGPNNNRGVNQYSLTVTSPLVNRGSTATFSGLDVAGNTRFVKGRVDIGAFELQDRYVAGDVTVSFDFATQMPELEQFNNNWYWTYTFDVLADCTRPDSFIPQVHSNTKSSVDEGFIRNNHDGTFTYFWDCGFADGAAGDVPLLTFDYYIGDMYSFWSNTATVEVFVTYSSEFAPIIVTISGDAAIEGEISLREAVALANTQNGPSTIFFASNVMADKTITLTGGELSLTSDVVILGPGTGLLTIDAGGKSRIFNISSGDVEIRGLTLDHGFHTDRGGAIYLASANLTLTGVTIANSRAYRGGGVFQAGGTSTMTDVVFQGNSTSYFGGGFHQNGGTSLLTNVQFLDNLSDRGAAGMCLASGTTVITNSLFRGNIADPTSTNSRGGGLYFEGASNVTLVDTDFVGNQAYRGGGIYQVGGVSSFENGNFEDNKATFYGGGMYQTNGTSELTGTVFFDNKSDLAAAGFCLYLGQTTLDNVEFRENAARPTSSTSIGGGFYIEGATASALIRNDTKFIDNKANRGAGIYQRSGNVEIEFTEFTKNNATLMGGAYFQAAGTSDISNSNFNGNVAGTGGAGFAMIGGSTNITATDFVGNIASPGKTTSFGGGFYLEGATATISDSLFENNEAYRGGGVYQKSGNMEIRTVEFAVNKATYYGGAYYQESGTSDILAFSEFNGNLSGTGGAGFVIVGGSTNIEATSFVGNIASPTRTTSRGGGFYLEGAATTATITDSFFNDNEAYRGGGIYMQTGSLSVIGTTFTENKANYHGGGFYQIYGTSTLDDVKFNGNSSLQGGGAVSISLATLTSMTDVKFNGNIAATNGAAIYLEKVELAEIFTAEFNRNVSGLGACVYNTGSTSNLADFTFGRGEDANVATRGSSSAIFKMGAGNLNYKKAVDAIMGKDIPAGEKVTVEWWGNFFM